MNKIFIFILVIVAGMFTVSCEWKGGFGGSEAFDISDSARYGGEKSDIYISDFSMSNDKCETIYDDFGEQCCMLRIHAKDIENFTITFGAVVAEKYELKQNCQEFYVPATFKLMTITHPKYGKLNYEVRMGIVPNVVYHIELMSEDYDCPGTEDMSQHELEVRASKEFACGHYNKSFRLHHKAAQKGNIVAYGNLSYMYSRAEGTPLDHMEAAKMSIEGAKKGDISSQHNLGVAYEMGQGIKPDAVKAIEWYTKAAEKGNVPAMRDLGAILVNGEGIINNHEEGFKWMKAAAEAGDPVAQYNLSTCYTEGIGTKPNAEKAFYWLNESAKKNNQHALFDLGSAYIFGEGVEVDHQKAFKYLSAAASQGLNDAYNMLGYCYALGNGCEKDLAKAIVLVDIAIQNSTGNKKINFMDSKGEFCLMNHDETNAKLIYKQMRRMNASYVDTELANISELCKYIRTGKNPY